MSAPPSPVPSSAPTSAPTSPLCSRGEASATEATTPAARLRALGYFFDDAARLRQVAAPSKGFEFVDQAHYDALGDVVLDDIHARMQAPPYSLRRITLPVGGDTPPSPAARTSYVFASADLATNAERCMVLLQGTGAVRAGQWARALCINESLSLGAVFPFLDAAARGGYSVLVLNPNEPCDAAATAERHGVLAFDTLLAADRCAARHLYFVSHSYGGITTVELLARRFAQCRERIARIAFTDAVHRIDAQLDAIARDINNTASDNTKSNDTLPPRDDVRAFVRARARQWLASELPLDTPLDEPRGVVSAAGCACVSAGHKRHEYTTGVAMPSILCFFDEHRAAAADATT